MLTKLVTFFVDFVLTLAVIGTLYALYLIAATGIFILAIFYIFKGHVGTSYDINKDSSWVPDSAHAPGKPLADNVETVCAGMLKAHFPGGREGTYLAKEKRSLS